jgi:hypothetical protein
MGADVNIPELALTSILLLRFASCSTPPPVCSLYTLAYQGEASPDPDQGDTVCTCPLQLWQPGGFPRASASEELPDAWLVWSARPAG